MKEDKKSIDHYIGNKIKRRRVQLKLSQAELASYIGVSAQQIQRYESGENTVAIEKLLLIASCLNCQPDFFYEGALLNQPAGEVRSPRQTY